MKKTIFGFAALMSAVVLAACGGGGTDTSGNNSGGNGNNKEELTFPIATKNNDDAIEDGELEAAVATDSQFKGLFQWEFYQDSYDAAFMAPSHEPLFANDDD
ncbi:oligopeptide ABC transporter substrate-binding protein, partial [Enterococcus faecium]|nr:oligopeptide ABC transporter substrate-binding protein [Enterococcus faecium]